uniref:Delta-9 oleate desaturase n=3 Tax=Eukaryota TaxID=2759 RepID=H6VQ42_ISOGA|nr:delta-9 oleate desaturase [Isochrysis galbana]|mmetsp:Transcript_2737/g.8000  ORF Transcript_2737/g.8000 Transcript_2737/m.8000 type:complete len:371 (+) Transcript_2737:122-1234(+)
MRWASYSSGLMFALLVDPSHAVATVSSVGLEQQRTEVLRAVEKRVAHHVEHSLLTLDRAWQPSDFIPDGVNENDDAFLEEVREMRQMARGLPDELLVVLIGDMITEEALPTYQTLLNTLDGASDPTGTSDTAWGRWSRQWTSEENRHGDLLNRYLYLTGRCNMRAVEKSIMKLIANGFNPKFVPDGSSVGDAYRGFVYTSFQERATKISHGNVGKLASKYGDSRLARICAAIAGDEARHEKAYKGFVSAIFEEDPDGAMIAYADMLKQQIVMPAELMTDGENPNLFADFARVAANLGVYTSADYTDIIEHLNSEWQVESLTGLSPEAAAAQEYVGSLPRRFRKLAERQARSEGGILLPGVEWSWLNGRTV